MVRVLKFISKAVFYFLLLIIVVLIAMNIYLHSNRTKLLDDLPFLNNGTISSKKTSLHLFKDFPNATISLSDVLVHDSLYRQHQIPLLKLEKLTGAISLKNLKEKNMEIQSVDLYDGEINIFTDENNYSNLKSIIKKRGREERTKKRC